MSLTPYVVLDVLPALPLVVLQLPAHSAKRITQGDIHVLMRMLHAMFAIRDGAATGGGYMNVDLVHVSLVSMFVRGFDNHLAANYVRTELLEALSEFVYARLDCR
jgi:hypothetical protein